MFFFFLNVSNPVFLKKIFISICMRFSTLINVVHRNNIPDDTRRGAARRLSPAISPSPVVVVVVAVHTNNNSLSSTRAKCSGHTRTSSRYKDEIYYTTTRVLLYYDVINVYAHCTRCAYDHRVSSRFVLDGRRRRPRIVSRDTAERCSNACTRACVTNARDDRPVINNDGFFRENNAHGRGPRQVYRYT